MAEPQLGAAGVYSVEVASKIPTIPALPTANTAMVGIAERGPINEPVLVTSADEYFRVFGSYTGDSDMTIAAQGFFQNGGQELHAVRVVHHTDINNPASKTSAAATLVLNTAGGAPSAALTQGAGIEPHNLEPGQFLRVWVDGLGPDDAVFNGTRATLSAGVAGLYNIPDASTLIGFIRRWVSGAQAETAFTVTFNNGMWAVPGAATAAEVAIAMNAQLSPSGAYVDIDTDRPRINTDQRGTGQEIEVTGGTANAALQFSLTPAGGGGNVPDIDAVSNADAKVVVETAVTSSSGVTFSSAIGGEPIIASNTAGASSSIQVDAASTAVAFGFDNALHVGDDGAPAPTLRVDAKYDGAYGNALRIEVLAPTSGGAEDFNLEVQRAGEVVERFDDVSMSTVVARIAVGSNLITAEDLLSTAADPRPAVGLFGPMDGGDDGLAGIADTDVLGSVAGGTGLHAFDAVPALSIFCIPGFTSGAVQLGLIDYVEGERGGHAFAILDPPAAMSYQGIVDHVQDNLLLGSTSRAAIYWPRVEILNPSTAVFGDVERIIVAPSGHIAGAFATSDRIRNVWAPPANTLRGTLRGVVGLETVEVKDDRKRGIVYKNRINPILSYPGTRIHIDGSLTLQASANFPSIGEVRGVIFVSQTLILGLAFAKHEPNTEDLRARVGQVVEAFLIEQMKAGAFATNDPATAFFVDVSTNINTPAVIDAGKLRVDVGLRTAPAVQRVVITISKDTRASEQELAGG